MPQRPEILALGSINADFEARVDEPLAAGGTLTAHDFVRLSGGKAANVAFLAHRFGIPTRLFGCTGGDDLREQALGPLRQAGIDLSHVFTADACFTGVSMIAVAPDGSETIIRAGNANDSWTARMLDSLVAAIAEAPDGSVLVVDFEVSPHAAMRAAEAAHRRGLMLVLDPAPPARVDRAVFPLTHAITPNPAEAAALTGIRIDHAEAAGQAARELTGRGVRMACVKLPQGGCVLSCAGALTHIPPVPVPVIDRTGAGDAFAGALAVALVERRPPLEAACFAVAASHVAVTAYGSQAILSDPGRRGDAAAGAVAQRPAAGAVTAPWHPVRTSSSTPTTLPMSGGANRCSAWAMACCSCVPAPPMRRSRTPRTIPEHTGPAAMIAQPARSGASGWTTSRW